MARSAPLWLCLCLVLASTSSASSAYAQGTEGDVDADVRALFAEGLALVDAERWGDAEDRFRRCLALRRSPVIEYNLASALDAQGAYVEASALLRQVLATPGVAARLRRASEERLERIEPRLAYVSIRVGGAGEGAEVTLDGEPIAPGRLAGAIPVDPGSHRIEARGPGGRSVESTQRFAPGERHTVQLVLPVPTPAELATANPPEATAPAAPRERPRRRSAWVWASVGAVVAAGAITTVFLTYDRTSDPTLGTLPPGIVTIDLSP